MPKSYDALVIGAGMSGMALAFRLSLAGKKVAILESHSVPGGLNSFYQRKNYNLDVGLHALTNFADPKKDKKDLPLFKLLKQMRWRYSDLKLIPQNKSVISYPHRQLEFKNDIEHLTNEIYQNFPQEIENFKKLISFVQNFDELDLSLNYQSAKKILAQFLKSELLIDMILCPLLVYGSAWENDMDLAQFVIMFKSIYLQGFMRPAGGVRPIINKLMEDLKKNNADIFLKTRVLNLTQESDQWLCETEKGFFSASQVFSTAGAPETFSLLKNLPPSPSILKEKAGSLSFTEALLVLDKKPQELGVDTTIVFKNNKDFFNYAKPQNLVNPDFAVLCFPNNFKEDDLPFSLVRITMLANFEQWQKKSEISKEVYRKEKENLLHLSFEMLKDYAPAFHHSKIIFSDTFTPVTVNKFTRRLGGAVYGSPFKIRSGATPFSNLYLAGTDQGFLGVIGSLLSGISIANKYGILNHKSQQQGPEIYDNQSSQF